MERKEGGGMGWDGWKRQAYGVYVNRYSMGDRQTCVGDRRSCTSNTHTQVEIRPNTESCGLNLTHIYSHTLSKHTNTHTRTHTHSRSLSPKHTHTHTHGAYLIPPFDLFPWFNLPALLPVSQHMHK